MNNPCLSCGACCAFYRVSFYWGEADDAANGTVPVAKTVKVSALHRAMAGTEAGQPRCCALQGEIGKIVSCTIYPLRASACREFAPSWENLSHNPRCDQARRAWGLEPLKPAGCHETTCVA